MTVGFWRAMLGIFGCIALTACGSSDSKKSTSPAKVETIGHEAELMKLTLTPDAEKRLGLQTVVVGMGSMTRVVTAQGEIVVPAASGGVPVSAQTDLAALASNQVRADGDIARARADLGLAQQAAARASALVREEAGSVRARDEAQSAVAVTQAALRTAQAQRNLLGNSPTALGRQGKLWVRVAASGGDLGQIDRGSPAQVRALGARGPAISGRPVAAPPSGNAAAGTVDLYYAIPNRAGAFRVGQRVAVDLPATGATNGLAVPASAILRDIYGGEWVYVRSAPHAYERRRIEIGTTTGGEALLTRGLVRGDLVVTAGAAELFGTEFGAK